MGLLLVFCIPVPIDLFYSAVLEAQKPAQHLPIRCDFFGDHVHSGEFQTYHRTNIYVIKSIHSNVTPIMYRADSTLAPSQWETSLQSNAVSHWLGANPQSADSRLAPSNERRRYKITPSLIGWVQILNQPCIYQCTLSAACEAYFVFCTQTALFTRLINFHEFCGMIHRFVWE